jgi:O-acetylhomoserine (thiol)-lyase
LNVLDVEKTAEIAHENGIPLMVDNTFASPYGSQPIKWGADIIVHSATKWISCHGTVIGGVVIDSGTFNWNTDKFPGFTTPEESYNRLKYGDIEGPAFAVKLRVQLLRDFGPSISANSAFLLLQGLETLHLRIQRHHENTQEVIAFLKNHPGIEWVSHPSLGDHPSHELAQKYLNGTFGSIVVFGIKGGRNAGKKAIDSVELWSHVANVGDGKSLIIHPASTTHQQFSAEDMKKSGVTEELVRLSIGLESPKDLIAGLKQAIEKGTGINS